MLWERRPGQLSISLLGLVSDLEALPAQESR